MSTSSPASSNDSALCTALPSGSRHEPISSGMPGFGTSVSQIPGSALLLTSAFTGSACSVDDAELASDLRERLDGAIDVRRLVRGGELHADPRLVLRHDRIRERDHIDALAEQP